MHNLITELTLKGSVSEVITWVISVLISAFEKSHPPFPLPIDTKSMGGEESSF